MTVMGTELHSGLEIAEPCHVIEDQENEKSPGNKLLKPGFPLVIDQVTK